MSGKPARTTILRWIPALLWMAGIFWLSSREALPAPPGMSHDIGAVAGHFLAYFVLALHLLWAFDGLDLSRGRTLLLAGTVAALYGLSDEFHQSFVPGRDASIEDVLVDLAGISCALALWSIRWRRVEAS